MGVLEKNDKIKRPKKTRFINFQCYNDAFFTKLSWCLLHNPSSLLGRALLGKYCGIEDFMTVSDMNSKSHGWRKILIGGDLLKANMGWAISNGESIALGMMIG